MNKYAHIYYKQKKKWIEICGDKTYLMNGEPLKKNFAREKITNLKDKELSFLPPSNPSKVIGVGWNYKDLVGEKETYPEPIVFLKSPTSICSNRSKIHYPSFVEKVWVEVELVIVIGKKCSNVSVSNASDYILGYTIGSDITALNILERDWHLARSKAFDNFAPIGPYLLTNIETKNLSLKSKINNKQVQKGNTSSRILDDCELVSLISSLMTLMPGDVIFSGTPAKATDAVVLSGDKISHKIDNFGELSFEIIS